MSKSKISDFDNLLQLCKECVQKETDGDQAVALVFQDGKIELLINRGVAQGNHSNEDALIDTLAKGDRKTVKKAVCMWNDGTLDIPSANLRTRLRDGGFVNDESEILLSAGTNGNVIKTWNQIK